MLLRRPHDGLGGKAEPCHERHGDDKRYVRGGPTGLVHHQGSADCERENSRSAPSDQSFRDALGALMVLGLQGTTIRGHSADGA